MKEKIRKSAVMLAMAVMLFSSGKVKAYAYVDETAGEPAIVEETPEETEGTPFSVSGNGDLLDDITDDETKQFLTVQTKNGNTFFLIIDRSRNAENVYMLSLVDENDLAEFIEKEPEPEEEKPAVVMEMPKPEPVEEEPPAEPGNTGTGMGAVLTILILGAGAVGGGYYYFKIVKPRREEEEAESEDLEFDEDTYPDDERENEQEEGE